MSIQTEKGYTIKGKCFVPNKLSKSSSIILIAPANAVKQRYYEKFASFLCENKFISVTFDYYGFGLSKDKPVKKIKVHMSDWGYYDIEAMIYWVSQTYPNRAIYIIGHSAGGQLLGLVKDIDKVKAIVMVAAGTGYWKLWKQPQKTFLFFFFYIFMPLITRLFGYYPGRFGLGENLPKDMAKQWIQWCRSQNYLFDDPNIQSLNYYDTITIPMLALSFTDDTNYGPPRAIESLLSFYPNAKITSKQIDPRDIHVESIGHFTFFKEWFKENLWQDVLQWIKNIEDKT